MIEVDHRHYAETGYPAVMAGEDTRDAMMQACGASARDFPQELWIEPRDWEEKAKENDANGTWAKDYVDRFTNQNPTHECTCHSLRTGFEACRNRARAVRFGGPTAGVRLDDSAKYGSVWVSPLSVYAEANPGQWGGASCRGVLEIACRRGFLPETIQPAEYGFKHSLHGTAGKGGKNQASGDFLKVSRFPAGWEETAKHFKVLEVIFPESYEQAVCLLLAGLVVNVGRDGHAVPWWRWDYKTRNLPYGDSYDVERADSESRAKRAIGGASAISAVELPDDWSKPAG